jgi:lipopolysaccharide biosynthesis regulator YciM
MILGNLYRHKGQVGRAINVHQALLQRTDLTKLEHAYALLCLGLDFRHGGFVDRALEAFQQVVQLDPENRYAFVNLQKLHEDQQQWSEAAKVRAQIARLDGSRPVEDRQILAFLRYQVGAAEARAGQPSAAAASYREAIDIDAATAPAYLSLGDVHAREGRLREAIETREGLVHTVPDRAYLAFERLERAYRDAGTPGRFAVLCEALIARQPQDWRARLALSRHHAAAGHARRAFDLLLAALPHNPHGLAIHQEAWRALTELGFDPTLVRAYVDLTRDAVFYLDPHVCVRCRYRSTELLWQCPQCHEWNTFVEERIAPAKDPMVAES